MESLTARKKQKFNKTKNQTNKEQKMKTETKEKLEKNYDKYYKIILLIPVILLILSFVYLYSFSQKNGDIIYKDITLTGGTSVEVNSNIDIAALNTALAERFEEASVRQVSDILTGEQIAFIVETTADVDEVKPFLEGYLGFELTDENSSIEFTGSSLSDSFYNQLRLAILFSFLFMAIVVFIIFRTLIPSVAVIFAAFSDIVFTIVIIDLFGVKLSTAGIIAILMLIGYSVDTDILLTTRVIKRKAGKVNSRIFGAFKTGITMTLTSLVVVLIGYFITASFSKVFSQIFEVLIIGLLFDILNTWTFNAGIIKWYAEKKAI